MPIIKNKSKSHFAQIANTTLRDKRLGLDTRGFLGELLSYQEDLDVSVEWLMEHFNIGRDKLLRMTTELKANGYLETPAIKGEGGLLKGKEWFIYGEPTVIRGTRTTVKADDSYKREDQEEKKREKSLLRKDGSSDSAEKPKPSANSVWTDFKPLLIVQGNEPNSAGGMIKKLINKYGGERVDRLFEANRELIFEQAESYGYFTEILKRDKTLNEDEAQIQTALKESRSQHNQIHAGAEFTPTYNPELYVKQWPILQRYIDEIASGARELPPQDKKAKEDEQKFNDLQMEQAKYFGRI